MNIDISDHTDSVDVLGRDPEKGDKVRFNPDEVDEVYVSHTTQRDDGYIYGTVKYVGCDAARVSYDDHRRDSFGQLVPPHHLEVIE